MQLVAAHVLEARRARHIVMLGLRREFADRHVFDHAPAQRALCLVGHGDAPVLGEVANPSSQDRAPRCAIVLAVPPAPAPYRASGLVLWIRSRNHMLDPSFTGFDPK